MGLHEVVNGVTLLPDGLSVLATVVLAGFLAAMSRIDAQTLRIPDLLSLPLIALGLALAAVRPEATLLPHLIGAITGYAVLALIGEVHFRISGTEGLGLGDAKLFAGAGAWLGWQALPMVLLIAALSGLAYALWRKARHPAAPAELPFGPCLSIGFGLVWLWTLWQPPV